MPASPPQSRLDGRLESWDDAKGFGFIAPVGGGPRVFAHISAFTTSTRPEDGDIVSFRKETAADGRLRATDIRGVGSSQPRRSTSSPELSVILVALLVTAFVIVSIRWATPLWALGVYALMSLVTFFAYRADKRAAQAGRHRTSESTLLWLGVLGGWPGAVLAQQRFRHKTVKTSFRAKFWLTVLLNIGLFVVLASPWPAEWLASTAP